MMGLKVVGVDHLYVGLATDSRVPASVVSESASGTIFAHKNIAKYVSTILSTLKCSLCPDLCCLSGRYHGQSLTILIAPPVSIRFHQLFSSVTASTEQLYLLLPPGPPRLTHWWISLA
ncbi:hypothetical protein CY34DRAFT_536319 [Suillus luteus UH-Slu-Lm8-n1]|uniref:Uncharacterized protein n=1 Tax=Suillus luteus UH-Slu-Lm8-n1 TaxID=930992 RepID=A0A0D0A5P8_9AGAM|nr:hypothetical protein CY34DRAFT_536319 [Suillus luteus UH-Slu-Lm8-n1]